MQSEIIDIYSEYYVTRNLWLLEELTKNIKTKTFKYISKLLLLTEPKEIITSDITDISFILESNIFKINSINEYTECSGIFKILVFNLIHRTCMRESFIIIKFLLNTKDFKMILDIILKTPSLNVYQLKYIELSKELFNMNLKIKNKLNRINILFYCVYIIFKPDSIYYTCLIEDPLMTYYPKIQHHIITDISHNILVSKLGSNKKEIEINI